MYDIDFSSWQRTLVISYGGAHKKLDILDRSLDDNEKSFCVRSFRTHTRVPVIKYIQLLSFRHVSQRYSVTSVSRSRVVHFPK